MMSNFYKLPIIFIVLFFVTIPSFGQCASASKIYTFTYDNRTYEIVKENKSWSDAASCAVERGGKLAEINDAAENTAIQNALDNAGIILSETVALDGGNASYVWLGGNDISSEGTWVWDGDNTGTTTDFWSGNACGSAVNSAYTNWGKPPLGGPNQEPDDFNSNQDGLGMALTSWPYGSKSEWNDISTSNSLFYVVKHSTLLSNKKVASKNQLQLVPNPVINELVITATQSVNIKEVFIANILGQVVSRTRISGNHYQIIDVKHLENGVYVAKITTKDDEVHIRKFVKK